MSRDNPLFYEHDLDATLRSRLAGIGEKVDAIPQDQFMNSRPEEVVEHLVSQMAVDPLVLYEDRAEMEQKETKFDVAAWRDRNLFGGSGPIYVAGVAITVTIPFTGDDQLWTFRPNQWQTVFPHGRVSAARGDGVGHLCIDMDQPADEPPDRFKSRLDGELRSIRFYIDAQRRQIEQFNAGLRAAIHPAVDARRARIEKHQGLKDVLGIPLRRREGAPHPSSRSSSPESSLDPSLRHQRQDTNLNLVFLMRTMSTSSRSFVMKDEPLRPRRRPMRFTTKRSYEISFLHI